MSRSRGLPKNIAQPTTKTRRIEFRERELTRLAYGCELLFVERRKFNVITGFVGLVRVDMREKARGEYAREGG
jgi:hypothetical protein